jgi:hypothetical protein
VTPKVPFQIRVGRGTRFNPIAVPVNTAKTLPTASSAVLSAETWMEGQSSLNHHPAEAQLRWITPDYAKKNFQRKVYR